jgi:hypothetical protein
VRLLKTHKVNSGRAPTLDDLDTRPTDLRAFLTTFKPVQSPLAKRA